MLTALAEGLKRLSQPEQRAEFCEVLADVIQEQKKEISCSAFGLIVAKRPVRPRRPLVCCWHLENTIRAKGKGGVQPPQATIDQDDASRRKWLLGLFKCDLHSYLEVVFQRGSS